jgi:hypothetical protein
MCNMYTQNKTTKEIYFKFLKQDQNTLVSTIIAIMLRYILCYRLTLYHNIAKLLFLNFIAVDT